MQRTGRADIRPVLSVTVVLKKDLRTVALTGCTVKDILTKYLCIFMASRSVLQAEKWAG